MEYTDGIKGSAGFNPWGYYTKKSDTSSSTKKTDDTSSLTGALAGGTGSRKVGDTFTKNTTDNISSDMQAATTLSTTDYYKTNTDKMADLADETGVPLYATADIDPAIGQELTNSKLLWSYINGADQERIAESMKEYEAYFV